MFYTHFYAHDYIMRFINTFFKSITKKNLRRAKKKMNKKCKTSPCTGGFGDLPYELIGLAFTYLDIRDVSAIQRVNSEWHKYADRAMQIQCRVPGARRPYDDKRSPLLRHVTLKLKPRKWDVDYNYYNIYARLFACVKKIQTRLWSNPANCGDHMQIRLFAMDHEWDGSRITYMMEQVKCTIAGFRFDAVVVINKRCYEYNATEKRWFQVC